jgi:hypothetical protein
LLLALSVDELLDLPTLTLMTEGTDPHVDDDSQSAQGRTSSNSKQSAKTASSGSGKQAGPQRKKPRPSGHEEVHGLNALTHGFILQSDVDAGAFYDSRCVDGGFESDSTIDSGYGGEDLFEMVGSRRSSLDGMRARISLSKLVTTQLT